ncbi:MULTISPECIES: MFS transporter [unclassified Microbacterium]|uniref:MFS transporter n=1 Tax=unclassified Microbacterium TaxID=2609290 RepID=UPI00217DA25E|nr:MULTISPECIES: MFS transporter [unclassified Microbacterium]
MAEVSTQVVGIAFAVNTVVIVLLQFAVLRLISGKRRTRVMQVMALIWALSWVLLGAAGLLPASLVAAIGVIAYMGVFAFGETMLQPTVPAMYNDLASDRTRGRYNAINSAAFQGGAIAGPLVAGVMLGEGLDSWFIGVMIVGSVAVGGLAMVLERVVTADVNGVKNDEPTPNVAPAAAPVAPGD